MAEFPEIAAAKALLAVQGEANTLDRDRFN